MASYKVAQDVEADDKLIGPFSFRQFIYLIIVAMSGAIAWGLWQLFPPLAILPLPVIIFFGALALPLRKDQPMETYLAAILSFYLKPKLRMWQPDGIESLVEITAPKSSEESRTKSLSVSEAERRLSYLATIADTQGWSIRNASMPANNTSMVGDVYNEASQTPDLLDESGGVSRSLDSMITKSAAERRQSMIDRMRTPEPQPQPIAEPLAAQPVVVAPTPQPATQSVDQPTDQPAPVFNPYPNSMRQNVISPLSEQPASTPAATPAPAAKPSEPATPTPPPVAEHKSTSETTVSPDIMNLANNSQHLSIETLAHEAQRIKKRKKIDDDEVVISLR